MNQIQLGPNAVQLFRQGILLVDSQTGIAHAPPAVGDPMVEMLELEDDMEAPVRGRTSQRTK